MVKQVHWDHKGILLGQYVCPPLWCNWHCLPHMYLWPVMLHQESIDDMHLKVMRIHTQFLRHRLFMNADSTHGGIYVLPNFYASSKKTFIRPSSMTIPYSSDYRPYTFGPVPSLHELRHTSPLLPQAPSLQWYGDEIARSGTAPHDEDRPQDQEDEVALPCVLFTKVQDRNTNSGVSSRYAENAAPRLRRSRKLRLSTVLKVVRIVVETRPTRWAIIAQHFLNCKSLMAEPLTESPSFSSSITWRKSVVATELRKWIACSSGFMGKWWYL